MLSMDERLFSKFHLDENAARAIQDVLQNEFADPRNSIKKAFNIYLQRRLSSLTSEQRAVLEPKIEKYISSISFNSKGRWTASADSINVPEELKDTVFLYAILSHEFEHHIQLDALWGSNPRLNARAIRGALKTLFSPRYRFRQEFGAMRAEWEFLHAMLKDVLERAKYEISRTPLTPFMRKTLENLLNNVHLPFQDYIRSQHAFGRYSLGSLKLDAFSHAAVTALVFVMALGALEVAGKGTQMAYEKICTSFDETQRAALRPICKAGAK